MRSEALDPRGFFVMLWIEWLVLFVAFPLVAYLEVIPISKFLFFAPPLVYALVVHAWKKPPRPERGELGTRWVLLRAALIIPGIFVLAYVVVPDSFLVLPRARPVLWILIMTLYPWVSALPQEYLYRRFYFWRYGPILGKERWMLWSSALVFGFLHVMYDNVLAIVMTVIGGFLFASAYAKGRRLIIPWLEHTAYGLAIFTSGLGRFFYEPVAGMTWPGR